MLEKFSDLKCACSAGPKPGWSMIGKAWSEVVVLAKHMAIPSWTTSLQ
jgi:hypothetical protein